MGVNARELTCCLILIVAIFIAKIDASCPKPAPVGHRSLDLERFAGTWHMLRAGPPSTANHPNDTVTCLDHTYVRSEWNSGVLEFNFKEKINGEVEEDKGIITISNLEQSSHWDLYSTDSYFPLDVIATDYDQYAVLYICNPNLGDDAKVAYMLMSRTRVLDSQLDSLLISFVEGLGLDANDFNSIGHDDCM